MFFHYPYATQLHVSLPAAPVPCPPNDNKEMQRWQVHLKPTCLQKLGPSTAGAVAAEAENWYLATKLQLQTSKSHENLTHYLNIPTAVLVLSCHSTLFPHPQRTAEHVH